MKTILVLFISILSLTKMLAQEKNVTESSEIVISDQLEEVYITSGVK